MLITTESSFEKPVGEFWRRLKIPEILFYFQKQELV
jgi:hypothetical protein